MKAEVPCMKEETPYWPKDLLVEPVLGRTPAQFLAESARELAHRTDGLLRAEVEEGSWGEHLVHDFVIVAPFLDDYAYRLFKVRHGLVPYPAEFIFEGRVGKVAGPEAFEARLRAVLAAAGTKRAISELVQYSRRRQQQADAAA